MAQGLAPVMLGCQTPLLLSQMFLWVARVEVQAESAALVALVEARPARLVGARETITWKRETTIVKGAAPRCYNCLEPETLSGPAIAVSAIAFQRPAVIVSNRCYTAGARARNTAALG